VLVAVDEPDVLADALPELAIDTEADDAALWVRLDDELLVCELTALADSEDVAGPLALAEAAEEPLNVAVGDECADPDDETLAADVTDSDTEVVDEIEADAGVVIVDEPLPVNEGLATEEAVCDKPEDADTEPEDEAELGIDAEKEDDCVPTAVAEADKDDVGDDKPDAVPEAVSTLESDADADAVAVLMLLEDWAADGLALRLTVWVAVCVATPVLLNARVGALVWEAVDGGLKLGGVLKVAVDKPDELGLLVADPDDEYADVRDPEFEAE
jgi:hypothetical protein